MGTSVLYFISLLKVLGFLAAVFVGGAVLVCAFMCLVIGADEFERRGFAAVTDRLAVSKRLAPLWDRLVRRFASDRYVRHRYREAGIRFGADTVDEIGTVRVDGDRTLAAWVFWEREYVRRGYRSVHWKLFEKAAIYHADIDAFFGVRMGPDEVPRYCAELYIEYRGRVSLPSLGLMDRAFDEAAKNGGPVEIDTPAGKFKAIVIKLPDGHPLKGGKKS